MELLQGLLTWSNLCRGCRAVPSTSKAVGLFVAVINAAVRRSPVKVSRNALCFSEDTWSVALYVVYSYLNIRETGSSCGTYSQWVWLGACRAIQQAGRSQRQPMTLPTGLTPSPPIYSGAMYCLTKGSGGLSVGNLVVQSQLDWEANSWSFFLYGNL